MLAQLVYLMTIFTVSFTAFQLYSNQAWLQL
jgi:hypothetical protein